MADARRRRRGRALLLWLLTAGVIVYAVLERDVEQAGEVVEPPDDDAGRLKITAISAAEVHPGDAVVVHVTGADPRGAEMGAQISGDPAQVLARRADVVVVRVPQDADPGKAPLRVVQGERRSKPRDLLVVPVPVGRTVRHLLGGIALLIFGLRTFSGGLRRLAGQRMRDLLGRLTRGSSRAVGMGAVVGGVTQLTTSAAGLTAGLLESQLLGLSPAVVLLIGAQLGAAVTGALFPITASLEGLLIIVVGVAWISLANDRRSQGIGRVLVGAGLFLYGLRLIHGGLSVIVSDPGVLPYLRDLEQGGVVGVLISLAAGVLLSTLLQGPGPVFALVVGLVEVSGELGMVSAMTLLAGTALGAGIDTLLVAWPSGREARRLALAHLVLGLIGTGFLVATASLWAHLADAIVPGDPAAVSYGQRVLLPHLHAHLAVAFVAAQLTVAVLMTSLARPVTGWARRRFSRARASKPSDVGRTVRAGLARAIRSDRAGLDAALGLALQGERGQGVVSEHALGDARTEVEDLFATLSTTEDREADVELLRRAVVAALQMQRAVEDLLRVAELAVERNLVLSEADRDRVDGVHELVADGMEALASALEEGEAPDLEETRAREIRLNAREAEGRRALVTAEPGRETGSLKLRAAELIDAYENVGNHLYRVCESLAAEQPDEL